MTQRKRWPEAKRQEWQLSKHLHEVGSATQNEEPISIHICPHLYIIYIWLIIWSICIHNMIKMYSLSMTIAIHFWCLSCLYWMAFRMWPSFRSKSGTSSRRVSYFSSRPKRCLRQLVNLDEGQQLGVEILWPLQILQHRVSQKKKSPLQKIAKWRGLKLVMLVPFRPLVVSSICFDPWDSEVFQTFTSYLQACFERIYFLVRQHMYKALKTYPAPLIWNIWIIWEICE